MKAPHFDDNSYGKSRVRLMKVTRQEDRHDLAELTIDVRFEGGDFEAAHNAGDNSNVLPTDTMKNTVYALSKSWSGEEIEEFALPLAGHFLRDNPQAGRVRVSIAQSRWIRTGDHSFIRGSEEKRTTWAATHRDGVFLH